MPEILPGFDTERYCDTLEELAREEAIRAIQAALLQLEAAGTRAHSERLGTHLDNTRAIAALRACLRRAGHAGFRE